MFSKEEQEILNFFKEKRNDFPILNQKINNNQLIYADNGATTQKPQIMIDNLVEYYSKYNSNIHRSAHTLAQKSDELYENTREKVAKLINSNSNEIVFTKGTTNSLNMVCFGLIHILEENHNIVVSEVEHHANLVNWQEIAQKTGCELRFIKVDEDFRLDLNHAKELIDENTQIVSINHISNLTGSINDVKQIGEICKEINSIFILDGAQSVPHIKIDVKELNCDFLAFSSHKMCGPTGVGILYGKTEKLELLEPIEFGGDMIDEVNYEKTTYNSLPHRLEAGTPNIADVIAFGQSVDYLLEIGLEKIEKHEEILTKYFLEKSQELNKFELLGSKNSDNRSAIFSFNIKGLDSQDVGFLMDSKGIAIRTGHHCVQPFHKKQEILGTARVSLYFYNTIEEIDTIIQELKEIEKTF